MNIEKMLINEQNTILEAMQCLDEAATKVLFIAKNGKLLAALTDGDIRRWILRKGDLNASVKLAANYRPKYLTEVGRQQAVEYMREMKIDALPVLTGDGTIKSIVLRDEDELTSCRDMLGLPVVMMAGGLGKRLFPYTNILPKPLIPIGDIPIAEHIINQFCAYGCNDYYLIVNHKKNMIKAYFNEIPKKYNIIFVDEDIPLGTGGGLSLLKEKINSPFILTNCDILIQEDFNKIYQLHKKKKQLITMICSLKNFSVPYGVVEIGEDGEIAAMHEKPQMSFFANTGCYIVEPEVIKGLKNSEAIDFPDLIEKYRIDGNKVGVYPIGEKSWLDMGQLDELKNMKERMEDVK